MKKVPLYSRSRAPSPQPSEVAAASAEAGPRASARRRLAAALARHERRLWAAALIALAAAFWWLNPTLVPKAPLTIEQIDAAMRQSIEDKPLIAPESRAYDAILPSVVRVVGLMTEGDDGSDDKDRGTVERGIGSGVVIVDKGDILTNLHVIHGAERCGSLSSTAASRKPTVVNVQPENDLAVISAKTQPDDLKPATLRSTADLYPGDTVVAVGFPFGIGPSVSSGVVSGLKREFRSPDRTSSKLTNLIQFDAAVNPGNSGGPLVNRDGEVVGIVTAIFNPTGQRVFAGIGFAVPIENAATAVGHAALLTRHDTRQLQ